MNAAADTIAAIATAPGHAGVGVLRISGPLAPRIAHALLGRAPRERHAHYATFRDANDDVIDRGLLIAFAQPRSYTGEDVVELHAHGNPLVLHALLDRLVELGARHARPGEFSERAFLNGKLDKKVWILWAEGRVNGDYDAIETPIGRIPKYEDLKALFKEQLNQDYTKEAYDQQFSIRISKYLEKMDRMTQAFSHIKLPAAFAAEMENQIKRLQEAKAKYGDVATPDQFLA